MNAERQKQIKYSEKKEKKILCEGFTEKGFEDENEAYCAAEITFPEQCTEPETDHQHIPQINCTTDLDVASYVSDNSYSFENDEHDLVKCYYRGDVKTLKRNLFIEQTFLGELLPLH